MADEISDRHGQVVQPREGIRFHHARGQEKEIFVHFTGILGEGYRNLEQGDRVSFVVEETEKGPQAIQVQVLGSAEPE